MNLQKNRLASLAMMFVMALIIVLPLAAEGAQEVEPVTASDELAPEGELSGTLTIWTFFDQVELMAEQFEARYPNVDVDVRVYPGNEYELRLSTALQTGTNPPDVFDMERSYIARFVNSPFAENLSEWGAEEVVRDYVPYVTELGRDSDGNIRGISDHASPGGFWYYRETALEYLGTDDWQELSGMFSTWDDVIELGLDVVEASDGDVHLMGHYNEVFNIEQYNHEPFIVDGALNIDPGWRKTFETAKRVREEGVDAQLSPWSPGWGAAINEGSVILWALPAWAGFLVDNEGGKAAGNYGVAKAPRGYYDGGTYRTIYSGSDKKELAWEFIKFIASPEWQAWNIENTGNMPGLAPLYDELSDEVTFELTGDQPILNVYEEIVMDITPYRPVVHGKEVMDMFRNDLSWAMDEGEDYEAAVARFRRRVESAFPDLLIEDM